MSFRKRDRFFAVLLSLCLASIAVAGLIDYKGRSVIETPTGAGGIALKNNEVVNADRVGTYVEKTSIPTVDDDLNAATPSFENGLIKDTNTNRLFLCQDATDGAAVWKRLVTDTTPSIAGDWVPHTSNPILSTAGQAFMSVVKFGTTLHGYYGTGSINHATSTDGVTWTVDAGNNPLTVTGNNGVPSVWIEGAMWHMLYRMTGTQGIGYATSSDGITWAASGSNPVIAPTPAEWDAGVALDPWGVIKVGATYYCYYNTVTGTRGIGITTATVLTSWTKDGNNPIWTSGRFCASVIKRGKYYYAFPMHYTSGTDKSEIEVYRDIVPTFYSAAREDLGEIKEASASGWDSNDQDTFWPLTDDIYRDSYDLTGGELWGYYAGELGGSWKTGLLVSSGIDGVWYRNRQAGGKDLLGVGNITTGAWSTVPRAGVNVVYSTDTDVGTITLKDEVNSGNDALAYITYWDSSEDGSGTTGRLGFSGYASGSLADYFIVNSVQDRDLVLRINDGGATKTIKWDGNTNQWEFGDTTVGLGTATPITTLHVVGTARFGDYDTNYAAVTSTGDLGFAGSAGFYPRVLSQNDKPAAGTGATQIDSGEYCMWIDTNDSNKVYSVYNNGGTVVAVLMAL